MVKNRWDMVATAGRNLAPTRIGMQVPCIRLDSFISCVNRIFFNNMRHSFGPFHALCCRRCGRRYQCHHRLCHGFAQCLPFRYVDCEVFSPRRQCEQNSRLDSRRGWQFLHCFFPPKKRGCICTTHAEIHSFSAHMVALIFRHSLCICVGAPDRSLDRQAAATRPLCTRTCGC